MKSINELLTELTQLTDGLPNAQDLIAQLTVAIKKQEKEILFWKESSYQTGKIMATSQWEHYYRGCNDAKTGQIYDPAFGRKFFNLKDKL